MNIYVDHLLDDDEKIEVKVQPTLTRLWPITLAVGNLSIFMTRQQARDIRARLRAALEEEEVVAA